MRRTAYFVGGPADGKKIEIDPQTATVEVPVFRGRRMLAKHSYTVRRCYGPEGSIVWVLAPAGRPVSPEWMRSRELRN